MIKKPYSYEYASKSQQYGRGFVLEERVQELLERNNSDKADIEEELDGCRRHVNQQIKDTVQRDYKRFIECAAQVEKGAQALLKVKEEVASLRSTLLQVANLPIHDALNTEHEPADQALPEPTAADLLKDEVELFLHEHDFEKAAQLVIDAQKAGTIEDRVLWGIEEGIVAAVMQALHNSPASSRAMLKLLVMLDRHQLAYDFFFSHRSKWVRSEVRRVRFVGDIMIYAKSAATAVFRGLAATYTEFKQMTSKDIETTKNPDASVAGLMMSAFDLPQRQKSSAVRWLSVEIDDFSELLASQIFSVEVFSDVFIALSEVFKACRDHLEPLSIDMLPYLHSTLEESALEALVRECLAMKTLCLEALGENKFHQKPEDTFEEIQAPPLWTRSIKTERLSVVLSESTQGLLLHIASLLGNVRAVCLIPPQGKSLGRPWTSLEGQVDASIAELIKEYLEVAFSRASQGDPAEVHGEEGEHEEDPKLHPMQDSQVMMLLSDVKFIVHHLIPKVSDVIKATFHKEKATHVDLIRDKSTALPTKLLESAALLWVQTEVTSPLLATDPPTLLTEPSLKPSSDSILLDAVKNVIIRIAMLRREAMSVFAETAEVDRIVNVYVAAVCKVLSDPGYWVGVINEMKGANLKMADNQNTELTKAQRNIVVANATLTLRAFSSYPSVAQHRSGFTKSFSPSPEDDEAVDEAFKADTDERLAEAMQELDTENRENTITT